MDSTALLSLFREEVRDQATPYLWSDARIYTYINEAQNAFCRRVGGIRDSTSAATILSIVEDDQYIATNARILKFRRAIRASDNYRIAILNQWDLDAGLSNDDYGLQRTLSLETTKGRTQAIVTGLEINKIKLIPIAEGAETINLTVNRLPLTDITAAGQALEIDPRHHYSLLHWMKHLAFMQEDAETFDKGRSRESEAMFEAYCMRAKAEEELAEHKPRAIRYGGL